MLRKWDSMYRGMLIIIEKELGIYWMKVSFHYDLIGSGIQVVDVICILLQKHGEGPN